MSVRSSSADTITFRAGNGNDLNRNLPFQALFTRRDLAYIHRSEPSVRSASDDTIIGIVYRLRTGLNRRAEELLSTATTNLRLCIRLCEQIRSFDEEVLSQSAVSNLRSIREAQTYLVAYRDLDNWLEQVFCIYERSHESQTDDTPSEETLSTWLADMGAVALVSREDRYEEVSQANPFVEDDFVMLLIRKDQHVVIAKRFSELYEGASPIICRGKSSR